MGLKVYNPYTKSQRHTISRDFSEITRTTPEKSLVESKHSSGGRNNEGHTTTRFRGGGVKRAYRVVDFRRDKDGVPAKVAHIEYDPNRTANIALLHYVDGEKRYIIAPDGLVQGATVLSGEKAEFKPGNATILKRIPDGVFIHNIELEPGKGGKLVRSAGQYAILRAKEGDFAQIKLPSGEVRLISLLCKATIGTVGNAEHAKIKLGKAGAARYLGFRPHVRGVAMNPVDHPHGGGEGRTCGGGHPRSPWGQLAKGKKTRNPRKVSQNHIVSRRK